MKKCAFVILLMLLTACCPPPVLIPVSTCPVPPVMIMPELSINRLPKKPEVKEGLKALMEDHIILKNTLEQCIINLEGYRPSEL